MFDNNASWLVCAKLYDENKNSFYDSYTIINATSYANAAEKVSDYFGGPTGGCAQLTITFVDDCPVELSKEEYDRLLERSF